MLRSAIVSTLVLAACAAAQQQEKQTQHHRVRVERVVGGLENPWSVAFLPGGDLLITEKRGTLRLVRNGQLVAEPIQGVPEVRASGQGGLLDVVLHPEYTTNKWVYLSYSKPGPRGATTAVVRGTFDGSRLSDVKEIIEAKAWANGGAHFGSRLAFDPQGFLYITIGERGSRNNAQDNSDHTGNVLRLHDDGRVPRDNPFVGQANVQPEIFTFGNRNPQGLAVHPVTGALYATEHGPRGGDELNRLLPGRNYGWPVTTYGIDYSGAIISELKTKEGIEDALHYWVPSIGTSGLAIYNGDRFPRWKGDFFAGGLVGEKLVRLRFNGTRKVEVEDILDGVGRVRDVRAGPDGYIYVLLDQGSLLRLRPAE